MRESEDYYGYGNYDDGMLHLLDTPSWRPISRQPDMGQAHAAATRRQAAPVDFGDIADDFQHCIHNVGIDDCAVRTIYKKRNEPA